MQTLLSANQSARTILVILKRVVVKPYEFHPRPHESIKNALERKNLFQTH